MGLKITSRSSSMFDAASGASMPPSLADQATEMGALETDFRGQRTARRDATQATNTQAKLSSEAKQTTGTPARLTTIRVDEKRQV